MDERAGTSPGMVARDFEGLANRIESIHTDAKQFRSEQTQINQGFDRRVAKLEFLGEQTGERLNGGAQTFSKLEAQIERVNAKIDGPVWKTVMKVVGVAAPTVMLMFSIIWYAAKMPDETKFELLKQEVFEQKLEMMKLQGTLSNMQGSVEEASKKSTAANDKLDRLLLRQTGGGQP